MKHTTHQVSLLCENMSSEGFQLNQMNICLREHVSFFSCVTLAFLNVMFYCAYLVFGFKKAAQVVYDAVLEDFSWKLVVVLKRKKHGAL